MKTLVKNYTFNPATKQITITNLTTISLEQVLLITNTTDNIIIYNFADPNLGATVSNNILTLDYNTASMSSGDSIQIFIDIPNTTDLETLATIMMDGFASIVSELQAMKTNQGIPNAAAQIRVAPIVGGYLDTISTISSMGAYRTDLNNFQNTNLGMGQLRNNIIIYGGTV